MRKTKFYNKFHKNISLQPRVIDGNNFTYRLIISELESITKGKSRLQILDFGCGVGTLSFYLANKGFNVIGVDISDKAIKFAKDNAQLLNLKRNLSFFSLREGFNKIKKRKFDLIICIEVLEHVKNDQQLLQRLANSLKIKGKIVISTPSINAPLYKMGLTNNFDQTVGHLRRYSIETLQKKVTEAGLVVFKLDKKEGIIRNSLFILPYLGKLVRFIKGPLVDVVTFLDNLTIPLFGESDIFIVAQKP